MVWNIFYFSIYLEEYSQLTNIFQGGSNHQPVMILTTIVNGMFKPINIDNVWGPHIVKLVHCATAFLWLNDVQWRVDENSVVVPHVAQNIIIRLKDNHHYQCPYYDHHDYSIICPFRL